MKINKKTKIIMKMKYINNKKMMRMISFWMNMKE